MVTKRKKLAPIALGDDLTGLLDGTIKRLDRLRPWSPVTLASLVRWAIYDALVRLNAQFDEDEKKGQLPLFAYGDFSPAPRGAPVSDGKPAPEGTPPWRSTTSTEPARKPRAATTRTTKKSTTKPSTTKRRP